jgi:hypothetical protein
MANNIERLNYYEREYLRSFDFIAEQNYHMEMRRRLNLALHLWGIVEGLDVKLGEIVPGAPNQFYISPGMAIDAYGREILLFAPYMLTEDDVTRNRITAAGRYSLFIVYTSELATPPSPGFSVCNLKDEYTRRRESFQIVIADQPDPTGEPTAIDELSDDPVAKPWPVRLGSVDIDASLTITNAWPKNRVYIGLRAQRIIAPVASLGDSAPDANRPISVEADLRARKNMIVGKDFAVVKADVTPTPVVDPFPSKKGNLKVRHDLLLRGTLYKEVDSKWFSLEEYLKSLMPDVLTGTKDINFPGNSPGGGEISGTLTFPVTSSRLAKILSAHGTAAISTIRWNTRSQLNSIVTNPDEMRFQITSVGATANGTNTCQVEVSWGVKPTLNDNAVFRSAILGVTISYVIVCYPTA